jgi:hypothetical protein
MSVIKGSNVVLYFLINGRYRPICCAREISFDTVSEIAETSTDETGVYRTYRGLRHTWSVTCNGLCSFDKNAAIATVRELQRAFTPVYISFTAIDENSFIETYSGFVLFESVGTNASYSDLYKYTLTGKGSGEYTITDNPVNPDEIGGKIMVKKYNGTGLETGGNTLPAFSELEGKEILWIERDGLYYRLVTGTPTSKQFIQDTDDETVLIFSDEDPEISDGEMIDIVYQNN